MYVLVVIIRLRGQHDRSTGYGPVRYFTIQSEGEGSSRPDVVVCVVANCTQLHVKWSDLGMGMCVDLSYGWCACGVGCVVDHRKMDRGG